MVNRFFGCLLTFVNMVLMISCGKRGKFLNPQNIYFFNFLFLFIFRHVASTDVTEVCWILVMEFRDDFFLSSFFLLSTLPSPSWAFDCQSSVSLSCAIGTSAYVTSVLARPISSDCKLLLTKCKIQAGKTLGVFLLESGFELRSPL